MSEHPVQEFIQQAQEQVQERFKSASMGAPLEFRGKTLIPVLQNPSWLECFKNGKKAAGRPLGFLEMGEGKTRFVKVEDNRWLLLGLGLAVLSVLLFLLGMGLRKRQVRKNRPSLW